MEIKMFSINSNNTSEKCGDYVVVNVWRPLHKGKYRTAARGRFDDAFVGHVSLSMVRNNEEVAYLSFWPTDGHNSIGINNNYYNDYFSEGEREPDARIPLFGLDIDTMQKSYAELDCKIENQQTKWVINGPINGSETSDRHNCATSVWAILKAGGIEHYALRIGGPKNKALRKIYKCDEGRLLWGIFDNFAWRKVAVSPVLLLHLVASAREAERKLLPRRFDLKKI